MQLGRSLHLSPALIRLLIACAMAFFLLGAAAQGVVVTPARADF